MGLKPVKVSQLNSYIKRILQTDPILGNVSVTGEISNLKFHNSGHVYFSLKDEKSRINCFLPSGNVQAALDSLEEGNEVIASGYIYLYERGGSYSLNVKILESAGRGDLAAAFEKLKAKLEKEGVFDSAHKKQLPPFPKKIAVVTSPAGAAVRDIVKIITSRNNCTDVLIYPVLVQGPDAAADIAHAIDDLNRNHRDVDIIITGRGGGSMEELWAFNEECVARSIYASDIPVISAVGHETDFTIADFAADFRAETPTAAAQMAVPDTGELTEYIYSLGEEMRRNLRMVCEDRRKNLEMLNPMVFARDLRGRAALEQLTADNIAADMESRIRALTDSLKHRVELMHEVVVSANPQSILNRGYSIVTDSSGNIVKSADSLQTGQSIEIRLAEGKAYADVSGTE
jgi:exodeoxyribonuclease VII large subunit